MPESCSQCGASTAWDDDVGSAVCTSCGTLTNPSQSVLISAHYGNQNDTSEPSLWDPSASTTLKSLRAGNNWDLAGQGKESRDRKNAVSSSIILLTLYCLSPNQFIYSRSMQWPSLLNLSRCHSVQPVYHHALLLSSTRLGLPLTFVGVKNPGPWQQPVSPSRYGNQIVQIAFVT